MKKWIWVVAVALGLGALGFAPIVPARAADKAVAAQAPKASIDVNAASAKELARLPGIGDKIAAEIVDYRTKNGPFKKVEDLLKVKGIGEKKLAAMKSQIVIK
jgi:competence protein ComEA